MLLDAGPLRGASTLIPPLAIPLDHPVKHAEELDHRQSSEEVLAELGVVDDIRLLLIVQIELTEYVMVPHLLMVKIVDEWQVLDEPCLSIKADLQVDLGDDAGVLLDIDVASNGPDL